MPYSSDAQRKFFHTDTAKAAGITGDEVKEFDKASKGKELPEHVKKMAEGGMTAEDDEKKYVTEVGQGIKEGINHDSDAVKSYLSSKFSQLLKPGMGEDKPQNTTPEPNPTTAPQQGMAEGGFIDGMRKLMSGDRADVQKADDIDPIVTGSSDTARGYSDGGFPHVTFMEDETPKEVKETTHMASLPPKMAEGGTIHKAEDRKKEPAKPKDVDVSHEKKLSSIYKAMGIKKYSDGGDVAPSDGTLDTSSLPGGMPPPPPSNDPGFIDWLKTNGQKLLGNFNPPAAGTPNIPPIDTTGAGFDVNKSDAPVTIPSLAAAPPVPAAPPVVPPVVPAAPVVAPVVPAAPVNAPPAGMPSIGGIFKQDTSGLTQGVNAEDRQALANKLQDQQHGIGAVIAQAVAGLGDALAAKGGKDQHSLQNIFSMQKTQRDEALANFDQARQDRIQKLQLQTQMGDNALKQAAAADAYGTDEHLNSLIGAPKGTMKKDLPSYLGLLSAKVAQQEKDADLYMKAHAQAGTDLDNAVKNATVFDFKPSEAKLQASGAKLADQYFNRAKGNVLVKPSDGCQAQWIPAQNIGKARQMDPNLQVQP